MDAVGLMTELMALRPVTAEVARVNRAVDLLARELRAAKLFVKIEKAGRRKVLYAATRRTRTPALLFNAHLDVVPAEEELFQPRRRGAWLYGRGTHDCLGNCAVIAAALAGAGTRGDAGAIFSTDEETGGETTAYMAALGYRGDLVLIMDGAGYAIKTAQKGILALRLQAQGRACHSSTPWKGRNAIDRLIEGYLKIKDEFPAVAAGDEWHATASGNVIRAGTVFNRVPDTAEMVLDVRYTEKENPGELLRRLRRRSGLQIKQVTASPVVYCDAEHPVLLNLRECMRRSLKRKISLGRINCATDARHFAALGVPLAILGLPGGGAHGRNERVQVAGMARYEALLRDLTQGALAGV